jgi:hypothetical protein
MGVFSALFTALPRQLSLYLRRYGFACGRYGFVCGACGFGCGAGPGADAAGGLESANA